MEKYSVNWNLDCLYESIESPKLKDDEKAISKQIDDFSAKYLSCLSISNLTDAVREYDSIYGAITKIAVYVSLYYQTRLKVEEAAAAYQKISEWQSECFSKLCRFIVEIQK